MLQQTSTAYRERPRALSIWLFVVAAMIVGMVVVGGITRLTESGLSITQWKPIRGIVPPLDNAQWVAEFDNYKRIPQYLDYNRGMTLAGFKAIYFWEYFHRLLGRLIGFAFALPLIWFAIRRQIPRGYGWRLCALLALGGLQGALGWLMVRSGLSVRTEVAPLWLAAHLLTACFTLAGMVWTALDLRARVGGFDARPARLVPIAAAALLLLFVQLLFGALTAGLRAGYAFASWPLMGDSFFPAGVPMLAPAWRNAVANPIVVQFIHRWLAFVVAAGLIALAVKAIRIGARSQGRLLIAFVLLQIVLGISTLMSGVEIVIAVAHQLNAALTLIAAVFAAHAIGQQRRA